MTTRCTSALLLVATLASCASATTELVVIIDSDVPGLDTIQIDVQEPSGSVHTTMTSISGAGAVMLPVTLGVVYRGGALSPLALTATGLASGASRVSRHVVTGFVSGDTRVVRLDLVASCVGITCGTDQSCTPVGCSSVDVPSETLAHFDGTTPALGDAGMSPSDAAVAIDAAGPDAWSACAAMCMLDHASATCTASNTCAIAACETGYSNCDAMDPTGCERSIRTLTDCGSCNTPCTSTAGTTTCADGTCRIDACSAAGMADCNGDIGDGCEIDTRNDEAHCGSCTTPCATGQRCRASVCH